MSIKYLEIKVLESSNDLLEETQRQTSPYLTRFEYTRLLSARTWQLSRGDPPRVNAEGIYDPRKIALLEIHQRAVPLVIQRTLPDGTVEIWDPNDMHIRDY